MGLAQAIAEQPSGVLLLQSDRDERALIELSSRLKRLFSDEIRIVLMSANHRTAEEPGNFIDLFVQYPVSFEDLVAALGGLEPTRRCILLIDDSKLVHTMLVEPLKDEGYEVFQAFDGAEGFEMAKRVHPDLIICDIEMPQMNGFEVCASVRGTEDISETYIIMSSTLGSAADQQKGFESGVDEYLIKPVVVPELIDRIQKFFTSASAGRENVLILEADDQISRNIQKSLTKQGFSAGSTGTIRDAVRVLKRIPNDVVISGTDLADGSVIDFFNALRGLPEDRKPDVLITASRDSRADQKMVMNAGAAGIISKPFTMDSLLASLERTLADRRAKKERAHLEKYVSIASRRMALEKSILSGKTTATRAYRRQATILFSDVVSFTARCERYTASEVVEQLNSLFSVMTRSIMESGGDIDKFIGDACMAYWLGEETVSSSEHALRTVLRLRG
ncbi:MAG: response regulator, partial [Acidimicrobiales bacterium]|nr:response regulator [Acidimicrobiales bacterium]